MLSQLQNAQGKTIPWEEGFVVSGGWLRLCGCESWEVTIDTQGM